MKYKLHSKKAIEYMNRIKKDGRNAWDYGYHSDIKNKKSSCIVTSFLKGIPHNVLIQGDIIRFFFPVECERLQTLTDDYTSGISDTQRFKAIGNGWTVDVIVHILKGLKGVIE